MNDYEIEYIRREAEIYLARISFYQFCITLAPDFYTDDRPHLKIMCDTLQALYEGRILISKETSEKIIVETKQEAEQIRDKFRVCKKLIMNIPPQHGKSRTLINFSAWIFGIDKTEKIITCSYNDSTASDFSRYTRDAIQPSESFSEGIRFSEIFPETKIKKGNAAFEKWALSGQHFSYLGSGIGGSITGKGGTILIVDDPIKGAEEAFNETHLDKVYLWYTSTFLSRVSAKDGEPIEIVNHTRWAVNDVCGRILQGKYANDWYVLKMTAVNENGDMLCESLLSKKRYLELKDTQNENIFNANYLQEPYDEKNKVFYLPNRFSLKEDLKFESSFSYTDVADEGQDFLASSVGKNIGDKIYITDVVYSQANTDITLGKCEYMILKQKSLKNRVESNSMGAMFGRELQRRLNQKSKLGFEVYLLASTSNKITRIAMEQWFIDKYFYFLVDEEQSPEYRAFYNSVKKFTKDGKNKKDDAPDCLSGLAIMAKILLAHLYEK